MLCHILFDQFFCHNNSDIVFYDFFEHVCNRGDTVVTFTSMANVEEKKEAVSIS